MVNKGVEDVKSSYGRCLMAQGFLGYFYNNFLASSPRIAPMFANTDMTKQKELLKSTINFVIIHAENPASFAKTKLESVAETHSRTKVNVPPDMYPFWVDSLVKTVKTHDPKFTPDIEKSWRSAVGSAIDILKSKY